MLVGRVVAHVLGAADYGDWDGIGWIDNGGNKVCHRSLPFGSPSVYPNVRKWINDNEGEYELYFVLTTRDQTISEASRINRFNKPVEQVQRESLEARQIIRDLLGSEQKCFIFSYETFMYLELSYLQQLYRFLGVESGFMPSITDGNRRRLLGPEQ